MSFCCCSLHVTAELTARPRADNVAAFDKRLSSIEQGLTHRLEDLIKICSQSVKEPNRSPVYPWTSASIAGDDIGDLDLGDEIPSGQSTPHSSRTGLSCASLIVHDGPVERFYGESSTYSHLVRSRNLVEKLLTAGKHENPNQGPRRQSSSSSSTLRPSLVNADPSTFAEVLRKYDSFSGPSKFKEHFEIGDDRSLELPPRTGLETAIETYLSEDSLMPPLFHRQTLTDAINEQYRQDRLRADESWILCFNNIILRSSTWELRTFRVNSFAPPSVDDNALSQLLGNANRALRQLERFCILRMVNVQALFLLVRPLSIRKL